MQRLSIPELTKLKAELYARLQTLIVGKGDPSERTQTSKAIMAVTYAIRDAHIKCIRFTVDKVEPASPDQTWTRLQINKDETSQLELNRDDRRNLIRDALIEHLSGWLKSANPKDPVNPMRNERTGEWEVGKTADPVTLLISISYKAGAA